MSVTTASSPAPRIASALEALAQARVAARPLDGARSDRLALALDARCLPVAARILNAYGFVALRRPGGPPTFLAYDPEADVWPVVALTAEPAAQGAPALRGRPPSGICLALLAPDGAGKSTVAGALGRHAAVPVTTAYMGLYPRGERSLGIPGLRLAGRLLRVWRRYMLARLQRARGHLVVFDRYPYDALLPGAAHAGPAGRLRRALLARCLPAPDVVVVLDAAPEVLAARKGERGIEDLVRQRAAYAALTERLPCRAVVVDAAAEPDAVRRAVTAQAWETYLARHGRRS